MKSNIVSQFRINDTNRVLQGDLLKNVDMQIYNINLKKLEIIEFPYIVVLSQDCDLEQDFNKHEKLKESENISKDQLKPIHDKFLPSILVSECFPAEQVRLGEHLENNGFFMNNYGKKSSTSWKKIMQNEIPRYHFLKDSEEFSHGDLVIDFKRYYTIPRDNFYNIHKDKGPDCNTGRFSHKI